MLTALLCLFPSFRAAALRDLSAPGWPIRFGRGKNWPATAFLFFDALLTVSLLTAAILHFFPAAADAMSPAGWTERCRFGKAAFLVLVVGVSPVLEEILFRGLLAGGLARWMKPAAAVAITAVVFGASHGAVAALPTAVVSLFLSAAYAKTGTLFAPMALHALYNAAALALSL